MDIRIGSRVIYDPPEPFADWTLVSRIGCAGTVSSVWTDAAGRKCLDITMETPREDEIIGVLAENVRLAAEDRNPAEHPDYPIRVRRGEGPWTPLEYAREEVRRDIRIEVAAGSIEGVIIFGGERYVWRKRPG